MIHISNSIYTEYKIKLLSFDVVAEYRDYEDVTGEQKRRFIRVTKQWKSA